MHLNTYIKNHFKAYDNQTTQQILAENFSLNNLPKGKTIFLCVGAIGAGKSTVLANMYEQNVLNFPYLSDKIVAEKLSSAVGTRPGQNQIAAATHKIAQNLVKSGHSFCWEPEDITAKYLEIVDFAKANGYAIEVFYVMTDTASINLMRKNMRAGQVASAQDVQESFSGISKQVIKLIEKCDNLYMFDNSWQLNQTNQRNIEKELGESFCL